MSLVFDPESIFVKEYLLSARRRQTPSWAVVVQNPTDYHIAMRFEVREAWLFIDFVSEDRSLHVEPHGLAEFHVRVDDQHADFPREGQVKTSVRIRCRADGWDEEWWHEFHIGFQQVKAPPDYGGVFAIDFGTTNSSCAVIDPGKRSHTRSLTLESSGSSTPSVIQFESVHPPDQPTYNIGKTAMTQILNLQARSDSYVFSAKRLLGIPAVHTIQNHTEQPGAEHFVMYEYDRLCSFIVDRLISKAEEQLERATIRRVVATYPSMFSLPRVNALRKILVERLQFEEKNVRMDLDEASAAALWFIQREIENRFNSDIELFAAEYKDEKTILAYDFGGGTIDISLAKVCAKDRGEAQSGPRYIVKVEILGCTGDPHYGGDDVTVEVFNVVKWRLAQQVALAAEADDVATADADQNVADDIARASDYVAKNKSEIDEAIHGGWALQDEQLEHAVDVLIPTRFKDLRADSAEAARNLFFELIHSADEMKIELSNLAQDPAKVHEIARFPLLRPSYDCIDWNKVKCDEVGLSMAELEARIRKPIERTISQAQGLFEHVANEQGRCPKVIHHILLAGQSSQLPLVQRLLAEKLQAQDVHFDPEFAKSSVAIGACLGEQLQRSGSHYRFEVETLVRKVPYNIGYDIAGQPEMEPLFQLGDSLPQKSEATRFDGDLLQLFSQAGNNDEPVYLGQFDFSAAPVATVADDSGRPKSASAVPIPSAGGPPVSSGPRRAAPRFKVEDAPESIKRGSGGSKGTVVVHYDANREIYAMRGGCRYSLIAPAGKEGEGVDIFSGIH